MSETPRDPWAEGSGHAPPFAVPRHLDPRTWSLTLRVVSVTVLLSLLAILAVGSYLSTVIADGLFEQRRERVLDEAMSTRTDLVGTLQGLSGATATQQQDEATRFVQSVRASGGAVDRREAALVPVGAIGGVAVISSDRSLTPMIDQSFADAVREAPDSLTWRSVPIEQGDGTSVPGLLVGTRVAVAGAGGYDLYILYSLQQEQQTLTFVQRVLGGGGLVLLALVVGIAIVIARMVTSPLRSAAHAAERIAAGDPGVRIAVTGADELARVGESFNDMADNLEQKVADLTELSRVQQRFVADVSHELRTPLTTIRMAAAVLDGARRGFPPEIDRTVQLLSSEVTRFEALLTDLLEISRFDAGAAELEAQRHDMGELVRHAVDALAVLAADRGCDVRVHVRPGNLAAVVDPRRIDRILRNLLSNALEHGAHHPVRVDVAGDETAVAVTVQDFGRGMTPEAAAHVFDRFWRADPSRARTIGGTGLGLSISVEDAHLHGGWLQAWGQAGQGAVFRLTLPRRAGGSLAASPLRLHRAFDAVALSFPTGAIELSTRTGELDLRGTPGLSTARPADLPTLSAGGSAPTPLEEDEDDDQHRP
ncbi:MtrAB system histidine kinase MtrB [Brachybacterium sp. AOP25-B2-12]|uniref:MtrAB system histidine kinase MtrB n=1 Tax=Brachybacterium sp. AOP25-B2-12 TaxID=3457710 RepID=UPI004033F041